MVCLLGAVEVHMHVQIIKIVYTPGPRRPCIRFRCIVCSDQFGLILESILCLAETKTAITYGACIAQPELC
jgi:hypothetical protein